MDNQFNNRPYNISIIQNISYIVTSINVTHKKEGKKKKRKEKKVVLGHSSSIS